MSWILLTVLAVVLSLALYVRRRELVGMSQQLAERTTAREKGSAKARLQYPHIDLSRCIGCGSCVDACPEEGVLGLLHGQAVVLHGARCVGHGRCAAECPVGAIAVTLGDVSKRTDIPALSDQLESLSMPGLFLAGEITGYALVRTAVSQGTAVGEEVARRVRASPTPAAQDGVLDLAIVGAGPAGLACALKAKEQGLSFVILEQEPAHAGCVVGGTVAKYPRRKLVMTQPVELPLVGMLDRDSYSKEELIEIWENIARDQELPVYSGQELDGVERAPEGWLTVRTKTHALPARHVCLALGRRGTPRRLGVPGEDLAKVTYSLLDAHSYQDRRILVVGGGDSAVEAALGLAEQPGNSVTLSYRREGFFRLKSRNERHLAAAQAKNRLAVLLGSEVARIDPESVELRVEQGGLAQLMALDNDEVFVLAGGIAPTELLERCGVSFDPGLRKPAEPLVERGTGLARALAIALALTLAALAWTFAHRDYYALGAPERARHVDHAWLRSSGTLGLALGVGAVLLVCANLAYLVRRSPRFAFRRASLQTWMTAHVATGILALLFALVHAAMAPRATVGGHALEALAFLVLTGAVGRYFYSFLPRAANGRELALDEVRARLASIAGDWDRAHREFGESVQRRVSALVAGSHWRGSFLGRVAALIRIQRQLSTTLAELRAEGRGRGLPADQLDQLEHLAREAHRAALAASHFEDLRGILASWRYFHRWVALLMVLLVVLHVVAALRYGALLGGGAG